MIFIQKTRKIFSVGVELGKPADGTAISFMELVGSPSSPADPSPDLTGHVRYLKRFPPGTLFTEIARWLSDFLDSEMQRQSKEKTAFGPRDVDVTFLLVIDQTAVGSSVVDMILKIVKRPAWRVVISGSHSQGSSKGYNIVPKQELISLVQARLETKQLKFAAALPDTKLLADELINYQDQKTNAMPLADTWREHPSDDLVFAVALACWAPQLDIRFSADWI